MRGEHQAPARLADASPFRFAVIVSRFNESVTGSLRAAALAALKAAGAQDGRIETYDVPGAFELPQAARAAADTGRFDAIVCLGCIIRGETPHFDHLASAVAHGLMTAAGDTGIPTDTLEQAEARSGPGADNKGREAAAAAIEMAALYRALASAPARPPGTRV